MAQTEAGFFVISVASPAIIPPTIPPTSNKVDRFPDVVAVKLTPKKIEYIKDSIFSKNIGIIFIAKKMCCVRGSVLGPTLIYIGLEPTFLKSNQIPKFSIGPG